MTGVRQTTGFSRLTFISAWRKENHRQARLRTQRPREDAARSVPRQTGLDTYVFFGSDLKSFSVAVAAGISYGAFVASRRRAHSEVIKRMQPDNSDESIEFEKRRFSLMRPSGPSIDGMRATEISEQRAAERRAELPRCNRCSEPVEEEHLREVQPGLYACPFCRGELSE